MLILHSPDQVGVELNPLEQYRPQELILAGVVHVHESQQTGRVVSDDLGAVDIVRRALRGSGRQQAELAAEHAMNHHHLLNERTVGGMYRRPLAAGPSCQVNGGLAHDARMRA